MSEILKKISFKDFPSFQGQTHSKVFVLNRYKDSGWKSEKNLTEDWWDWSALDYQMIFFSMIKVFLSNYKVNAMGLLNYKF